MSDESISWAHTLADKAQTIAAIDRRLPVTRSEDGAERSFEGDLRDLVGPPAQVDLGRVLGEGGMGVVRLGTQRSLSRQVAVKSVKATGPEHAARLLREAWVTGYLEHPNIVPVYDIVLDQGAPLIVLKRIDGTEWSALLRDPAEVTRRFGVADVLAWHVGILVQVCNAVHYAHTKGIIHRDLKPENVMIGEFGEVYVLDWGIALSLTHDHGGRILRATDATEMAGTPVYMAPEMVLAPPSGLDERTDVYLLGAILFEIIAGSAPHLAETPLAVLLQAARSAPEIPADVDDELASIVRHAMARDRSARCASADALKKALTAYLEHRGSSLLARDAEARLVALREAIAAPPDAEHRVRVAALFSECRFALEHALARWPESPVAQRALREAQLAMVEHALASQAPERAREILATIATPPAELAQRVDEALSRASRAREEIEALAARGREADPAIHHRARARLNLAFGSVWVALPLLGLFGERIGAGTWSGLAGLHLVLAVSAIVAVVLGRDWIVATVFNRVAHLSFCVAVVATSALHAAAYLVGLEPSTSEVLSIAVWLGVSGMAVVALDVRLALIPLANLVALLVSARWPEVRYFAMSAALFVLLVNAQWLYREQGRRAASE
ncbi:serine/threonine-protein kinase [Sandaracinus amylolyticus]|uniref:Serine/threonine protein kinase n=1 Tax=Sandaracinus amylolyticus TaxID=927083 RepID=A0A0F6SD76_9BACT|nr:serine/threonine-protein kinase [Sandaracinus amylolyticus]AKF02959.1 serine/threonine protein kinase [Sandaracinus amylolyticus]